MDEQIHQLYKEYIHNRRINIPKDQFVYLTKLYPALLVCMSDGVLDREEWDGIIMATRGLAAEFVKSPNDDRDMIALSFRTEIRYLLDNVDKWKKKFLNALHHSIKESPLDQEFVLETMYLFANIADGISEEEENAIQDLARRLDIRA
ncbi:MULTISPECIES: hypothetical protein [Reichenbachiella]|uniref:Tellurite resistance protein TerB n=1 Tax=Reichenbachiella agariperforans TaxID=156994 RepID=A0A1M6NX22_REIAG|nr:MULTISPECIES: hypothetical protein [Reichenbachiella]MBU2916072.1 hypothetical protein [Reichenbachiella agariperforans]RJE71686.1 hypothetical protein BGP76_06250 [Reichenbachiella sp. MSK19-1]SHK00178.1 hypothetical protein SAMN04488028_102447 [Reichenbachiella agariperforans]